jgi:hypothetical protein
MKGRLFWREILFTAKSSNQNRMSPPIGVYLKTASGLKDGRFILYSEQAVSTSNYWELLAEKTGPLPTMSLHRMILEVQAFLFDKSLQIQIQNRRRRSRVLGTSVYVDTGQPVGGDL